MSLELRNIKISSAVNPRSGGKPTSAELYFNGKKAADLYDEANGGELRVYWTNKEDSGGIVNMLSLMGKTLDEWFAEEADDYETMRSLMRKTRNHFVAVNKKTNEMMTRRFNASLSDYKDDPKFKQQFEEFKAKAEAEGFTVLNKNI